MHEMARVLRDGGSLFVLWNGFSRDVAWLQPLIELRDRPDDDGKRPRGWAADLGIEGDFDVESQVELDWTWTRSVDETSWRSFPPTPGMIIRSDAERREVSADVRERLEAVAVDGVVELPMTVARHRRSTSRPRLSRRNRLAPVMREYERSRVRCHHPSRQSPRQPACA